MIVLKSVRFCLDGCRVRLNRAIGGQGALGGEGKGSALLI